MTYNSTVNTHHLHVKNTKTAMIARYVLLAISGYLALNIIVYLMIDYFIYQPPMPPTYIDSPLISKIKIVTPKNTNTISAIHLPNPGTKYTILYLHGNAGDLGDVKPKLHYFRRNGYGIMSIDYPGYGTSTGQPSEDSLMQSTRAAFDFLTDTQKIPANRIIIYGKSLGGALALQLALEKPAAGLVLDSTFLSALRTVSNTSFEPLLFDRYRNANKVRSLEIPVLFIHGTDDSVVRPFHTQKLYDQAPNALRSIYWVENAGHNNVFVVAGNRLFRELDQFIKQRIEKSLKD